MENEAVNNHKIRRQIEEDHTPLWIKLFGGTIISITFLCAVTVASYIINNLNNLQNQINSTNNDGLAGCKERLNIIEQLTKDRQILHDQQFMILREENKQLTKDLQLLREKFAASDGKVIKEDLKNTIPGNN